MSKSAVPLLNDLNNIDFTPQRVRSWSDLELDADGNTFMLSTGVIQTQSPLLEYTLTATPHGPAWIDHLRQSPTSGTCGSPSYCTWSSEAGFTTECSGWGEETRSAVETPNPVSRFEYKKRISRGRLLLDCSSTGWIDEGLKSPHIGDTSYASTHRRRLSQPWDSCCQRAILSKFESFSESLSPRGLRKLTARDIQTTVSPTPRTLQLPIFEMSQLSSAPKGNAEHHPVKTCESDKLNSPSCGRFRSNVRQTEVRFNDGDSSTFLCPTKDRSGPQTTQKQHDLIDVERLVRHTLRKIDKKQTAVYSYSTSRVRRYCKSLAPSGYRGSGGRMKQGPSFVAPQSSIRRWKRGTRQHSGLSPLHYTRATPKRILTRKLSLDTEWEPSGSDDEDSSLCRRSKKIYLLKSSSAHRRAWNSSYGNVIMRLRNVVRLNSNQRQTPDLPLGKIIKTNQNRSHLFDDDSTIDKSYSHTMGELTLANLHQQNYNGTYSISQSDNNYENQKIPISGRSARRLSHFAKFFNRGGTSSNTKQEALDPNGSSDAAVETAASVKSKMVKNATPTLAENQCTDYQHSANSPSSPISSCDLSSLSPDVESPLINETIPLSPPGSSFSTPKFSIVQHHNVTQDSSRSSFETTSAPERLRKQEQPLLSPLISGLQSLFSRGGQTVREQYEHQPQTKNPKCQTQEVPGHRRRQPIASLFNEDKLCSLDNSYSTSSFELIEQTDLTITPIITRNERAQGEAVSARQGSDTQHNSNRGFWLFKRRN